MAAKTTRSCRPAAGEPARLRADLGAAWPIMPIWCQDSRRRLPQRTHPLDGTPHDKTGADTGPFPASTDLGRANPAAGAGETSRVLAGGSRAGPVPRGVRRAYPVVSRLPGPVGVLGDHAHRRVRRVRGVPPDDGPNPRLPV